MTDARPEHLRRVARAKSDALANAALESSGKVRAEDVEELDRLVRLIELQVKLEPPKPQRTWLLAALLATTLLVVSTLLFARVRETTIQLDLKLTEVGFVLSSQQVLAERLDLSRLGAAGFSTIDFSDVEADTHDTRQPGAQQVEIASIIDGPRRGSIVLKEIAPPAGTEVRFSRGDEAGQYRFRIAAPQLALDVAVHGPIELGATGLSRQRADFSSPRGVAMGSASGTVDLDVTFRDLARARFVPQIRVDKLSFLHVADRSRDLSIVRALSTIASGTLYFESLNGASRGVRAGELLRLEEPRGEIRTLLVRDEAIALDFHGRVRGISVGEDDSRQNLMPTWLDWLRAQHGLSLLWGTTFYLFGLALAALRWFKVPV